MLNQSTWFRAFAAILAGYTLLASGRALVPGLCATQAAVESRLASCCAGPSAGAEGRPSLVEPQPERPACAFCNLAKGAAEPTARITPPEPAATFLICAPAARQNPPRNPAGGPTRSRSPPVQA